MTVPPQSQPVVLRGATIHTVTNGTIQNGTIVLDGGIDNVVPRPQRSIGRSTAVMIPPAEMHHFSYDGGGTQMLFFEPDPTEGA